MQTNQTTPLVLRMAADGDGTPLPLGLAGYAKSIEGMPVHYRRAKIARCGKWTHRGTGEAFEISPQRADEWVRNTTALAAAGVTPFLPDTHVTDKSGATNHGYVLNVERDGDDVYAVLQLIGDKALEAAATRGRSVYVVNDARDAHGRVYPGESLAHVALVPNPALPDLGPTVRIAASASAAAIEVPVLEQTLTAGAEPAHSKEPPMFKPETLEKLRAKFQDKHGTKAAELTVDEVAEKAAALALADPPKDRSAEVTALSADKTRLEGELAAEKQRVLSLSASAPKAPDPEVMRDRADNYTQRLDLMVDRGDMPKYVADKIKAVVKPTAVLMLSAAPDLEQKRPIDFVLSLFDGAKLGIQTGNAVTRPATAAPLELSGDKKEVDYAKIAAETVAKETARLYGPTAKKLGAPETVAATA